MDTKLIIYSLLIICFFFSCKKEIKQENNIHLNNEENIISDQNLIISVEKENFESYLGIKVKRLSKLKYNYILKRIDTLEIHKSTLISGLEWLCKSEQLIHNKIDNLDIEDFKSEIYRSNFAFLKGTVTINSGGNTYPRIKVEEYIFKSKKSATEAFNFLSNIKKIDNIWFRVSKAPNLLFLEENRIYYIISGGWYMMDIYREIGEELKKVNN
ncbi:hypothetical protein DIS18_02060 [Algibacter marinivivus]|uniref:Uncharacterized protein n=1 Tax=Algibacter marinivivus TaxID=2100723 RepID=A0A2U2X6I6_9FLAO|nr:hypothetical protein [Algibacter marinivivus]PWH83360.1 hypothetical protein DIS18_02060 [Algibacter marinivivus]